MKYFAKITQDFWTLKNKVNKDAREIAKQLDGTLLNDETAVGKYLADLAEGIQQVNLSNRRCKPLQLQMHGPHIGGIKPGKEIYAYISSNFHITIYPVKHE